METPQAPPLPQIPKTPKILFGILASLVVVLIAAGVYFLSFKKEKGKDFLTDKTKEEFVLKKFSSDEEFKTYFQRTDFGVGSMSPGISVREQPSAGLKAQPERFSETNVQVQGIDEPDLVKNDGNNIYFSQESRFYPLMERSVEGIMPPIPQDSKTKIIKAQPVADLKVESEIDRSGNLLLLGKVLAVFSGQTINGYDVSEAGSPAEKWKIDFGQNNRLVGARSYNGKIYFITQSIIQNNDPCPIKPYTAGNLEISIPCIEVYRPIAQVPADVTYTISVLDASTGSVEQKTAFAGSSFSSIIYMSKNNIYLTYDISIDMPEMMYRFYSTSGRDLISDNVLAKLERLRGYDISNSSKYMELSIIIENYLFSLSDNERLRVQNEISNRMQDFTKENGREFEKTGLVKIKNDDLSIQSSGSIPGSLLNQYSLDEYQDNLRIATTIGETVNDIYVLNNNLEAIGSALNLGLGERIYSVRFLEDKGYLVTFKQIDPFFVLDLSDPNAPRVAGQLKIPGFSSYLHPLENNLVLGVGKEGSQVKLSLFDVSSASEPIEKDKYLLEEYTTDVLSTATAFLLDSKHKVFFIPGNKGGYVFSYDLGRLSLKKAISGIQVKRAVYINDLLYVLSDEKITIISEQDWSEVNQVTL